MNSTRLGRGAAIAAATALAAFALTACGTQTTPSSSQPAAAGDMAGMTTGASDSSSFNDADVAFAQMMIGDHKMVAKMAALAEKKASSSDLKKLAAKMGPANTKAADKLEGWLKQWGKPTTSDMGGMSMPGAMTAKDMDMLTSMSGMQFDMMFAQMMVKHHEGSLQMARDETTKGKSADAKAMATDMVDTLTAQTKTLQALTKM